MIKTLLKSVGFIFFFGASFVVYSQGVSIENPGHTRTRTNILDVKKNVSRSIWKVNVSGVQGSSTGFFISPNQFIINFHSILHVAEYDKNLSDMFLSQEGNSQTIKVKKLLNLSSLYDLALLEVNYSASDYLTLRDYPVKAGEAVFISGYPGGNFSEMTGVKHTYKSSNYIDMFSINYDFTLNGSSGSPSFDQQGRVTGVVFAGISTQFIGVTQLNDLQSFVDENVRLDCLNFSSCVEEEIISLHRLAQGGSVQAQLQLTQLYKEGVGVNQNHRKMLDWYRKAAEQGDSSAQVALASIYSEGKIVEQDWVQALDWYRKAAEQGDYPLAQYSLGNMYWQGEAGLEQDWIQAFDWYRKAAEQGYSEAQNKLGMMYLKGIGGVEQDLVQALYWCRKAAEQGDANAQYNLGWLYVNGGEKFMPNLSQALRWFQSAANRGHIQARYIIQFIQEN